MGTLASQASPISLPSSRATSFRSSSLKSRPTIKRAHHEASDMEPPSSPSKRSKVAFSTDIEYASAGDENFADPYLIHEQVRRAINRHLVGTDDEPYDTVKRLFATDPKAPNAPSPQLVHVHLQALLARVSSLDRRCSGLVNAVLTSEWLGRDEPFVKLFTKFLANLGAAKPGFLGKILQSLVDLLGQQHTRRLPGYRIVRESRVHARVRRAIMHLLHLVPAASSTLADLIQRRLNKDSEKPNEILPYVKNFLAVIQDATELKSVVLGMITSELVKLDVSIQIDMEDYADDLGEEIVQEVSTSQTLIRPGSCLSAMRIVEEEDEEEDDSGSTTTDDSEEEGNELDPLEERRRKVMQHLETVDIIMDMMFEYYDPLVHSQSLAVCDDTMNLLTAHFSNLILPTYRSRHTQFLIFHFSQTSPLFVDKFATTCISMLLDHKQPSVLRQTAGSYLAGFVGRGAQVPSSVIGDCFRLLCDELELLRQEYEPSCRAPDLRRYTAFYSMMQAIMYIFCFRWRVLAVETGSDDDSDDEQETDRYIFPYSLKENLVLALNSPLNPLRICTSGIVGQFAEICHRLHFLYLFPKIEKNKQVRLSTTKRDIADVAMGRVERDLGWVEERGMLEAYFPFDPYRLPRSKRWVVDDYLDWKGLPGEDEENDDDDTEDEIMNDNSSVEGDDTATDEDT